jgi:hypothetical protein
MGIFQEVSNWVLGSYKVRTTQATDGAQLQHVRIDIGTGTGESQVNAANPLPVSAAISGTPNVNVSGWAGTTPDTVADDFAIAHAAIIVQAMNSLNFPQALQADVSGRLKTVTDLISIGGNPTDFFTDTLSVDHGYIPGGGYNEDNQFAGALHLKQSAPSVSSVGLITRNIPSGTQDVSIVSETALVASAPVSVTVLTSAAITLLAANANRRKFIINNFNGSYLFVKFGSAASSTDYSVFISPFTTYESFIGDYAGIITARANTASCIVLAQELT